MKNYFVIAYTDTDSKYITNINLFTDLKPALKQIEDLINDGIKVCLFEGECIMDLS